jgi:hypothetical protein
MKKHIILGIHITNRMKKATSVQKLLTEYGCNIKTRIGLHEVNDNFCATNGMLLLELTGDEKKCLELTKKLSAIPGIEVKKMVFKN